MQIRANILKALGLVVPARFVGGTISGPPAEGTWQQNDYCIDSEGVMWICTEAGTPGTWRATSQAHLGTKGVVGPAALNGALLGNGEDTPTALIPRYCRVIIPRTGVLRDLAFMPMAKAGNYNLIIRDCGAAKAGIYSKLGQSGSKEVSENTKWQVWDPQLSVKRGQNLLFGVVGDAAGFKIAKATLTTAKLFKLPTNRYLNDAAVEPKLIGTTAAQADINGPEELAEATLVESSVIPLITGVVE